MLIKEQLKKIPGLQPLVRRVKENDFVKNRIIDAQAISCFMEERKVKREDGPIRVGFLVQSVSVWSKVESLYQMMKNDDRFETFLLCVPLGVHGFRLIDPDSMENDTYNYFVQHGYDEAINTLIAKETWLDLKSLNLSYIFYPRPYNMYMPLPYITQQVSRYCKICLVMYGIEISEETTDIALNRDFMSNVYFYFSDFKSMQEKNIKKNRMAHFLGLQRTECTGYPMIEHLHQYKDSYSTSWAFSKNNFRVIWTPRWTTDLKCGGTNFFLYYTAFLDYAENHRDIDFLFRPHPLAFSHFIDTNRLTEQEVAEYKQQCEDIPNVSLDPAQTYEATFWNSSVLVSDISSIMPEFFSTGKPLIFCASNMEVKLAPHIEKMLEGCYVVYNADELFQCVAMLKEGNDPLFERRQEVCKELFGTSGAGTCALILDLISSDYRK